MPTQGRQARVQDLQGPLLRTVSCHPSSSPKNGPLPFPHGLLRLLCVCSCYETKHSSGWLSSHQWVSYADSRKGWQTVPGRTPKDPPYYFNASTGKTYK